MNKSINNKIEKINKNLKNKLKKLKKVFLKILKEFKKFLKRFIKLMKKEKKKRNILIITFIVVVLSIFLISKFVMSPNKILQKTMSKLLFENNTINYEIETSKFDDETNLYNHLLANGKITGKIQINKQNALPNLVSTSDFDTYGENLLKKKIKLNGKSVIQEYKIGNDKTLKKGQDESILLSAKILNTDLIKLDKELKEAKISEYIDFVNEVKYYLSKHLKHELQIFSGFTHKNTVDINYIEVNKIVSILNKIAKNEKAIDIICNNLNIGISDVSKIEKDEIKRYIRTLNNLYVDGDKIEIYTDIFTDKVNKIQVIEVLGKRTTIIPAFEKNPDFEFEELDDEIIIDKKEIILDKMLISDEFSKIAEKIINNTKINDNIKSQVEFFKKLNEVKKGNKE